MTKRRLKKMIKRAINLPKGWDLVKYVANKIYSLMLNVVLVKEKYHQMEAIVEFTAQLGIKYLNIDQ
jgi:MoaA/NifB/PqqE/SkfB family radical SAM enzyme